jgi:cyclic pyranopterin monophosphate synthase
MKKLDHIDDKGKISMIDITNKPADIKEAEASGFIHLKPETIRMIKENELEKGEVIAVAEIAGIQAAKNASNLVPLVHQVPLTRVDVKAYIYPNGIEVKSLIRSVCQQGLETEALTAVSVALLTLFEICKGADASLAISDIRLTRKIQDVT